MDPLLAIVAGTPKEEPDLNAIAQQLRSQQGLGFLGQLSGDKVLSPIGKGLTNRTFQEAQQIGLDRWRQQQAQIQEDRYKAAQARADRQNDAVQSRFDQTKAWQFAKQLESSGIAETAYPMQNMLSFLETVEPGKLKGVGMLATPEKELTEEGRQVRQLYAALRNPILLARSGAAVTDAEAKRLLEEFGRGTIETDEEFRRAIQILSSTMSKNIGSLYGGIGGTGSTVGQMYIQGAGDGAITPDMFSSGDYSAPSENEGAWYDSLPPDERARAIELEAKMNGT